MNIEGIQFGTSKVKKGPPKISDYKRLSKAMKPLADMLSKYPDKSDGEDYEWELKGNSVKTTTHKTEDGITVILEHDELLDGHLEDTVEEYLSARSPVDLFDEVDLGTHTIIKNGDSSVIVKGNITRDMKFYCWKDGEWVNRINSKDKITK